MSAHTPEPWPEIDPTTENKVWAILSAIDARRFISCYNACEGMADPAAELARLRACERHLVKIMALSLRTRDTEALTDEYERAEKTLGRES